MFAGWIRWAYFLGTSFLMSCTPAGTVELNNSSSSTKNDTEHLATVPHSGMYLDLLLIYLMTYSQIQIFDFVRIIYACFHLPTPNYSIFPWNCSNLFLRLLISQTMQEFGDIHKPTMKTEEQVNWMQGKEEVIKKNQGAEGLGQSFRARCLCPTERKP